MKIMAVPSVKRSVALIVSFFLAASLSRAEDAPLVRQLSPEVFQVGSVRLDKRTRTATFPASVNLTNGLVEYFAVNAIGKTHESVLVSDTEPYHLHMAMLLLGVKIAPAPSDKPPAQIDPGYLETAPEVTGETVEISVTWMKDGQPQQARAEDWVWNTKQKAPMKKGPWIYNGSLVSNASFVAQNEGSMITLVADPAALVNNPRAGHNDDLIWTARSEKLPPVGTPVDITITLLSRNQNP